MSDKSSNFNSAGAKKEEKQNEQVNSNTVELVVSEPNNAFPSRNYFKDGEAHAETEPGKIIFVGNLAQCTMEDSLRNLFSKSGEVNDIQLIASKHSPMMFAFITFSAPEGASNAIETFHSTLVEGRNIVVEYAIDKSNDRGGRGRRGGRGKGGGRHNGGYVRRRRGSWTDMRYRSVERARIDDDQDYAHDPSKEAEPAREPEKAPERAPEAEPQVSNLRMSSTLHPSPAQDGEEYHQYHTPSRGRGRGEYRGRGRGRDRGRGSSRRSNEDVPLSETMLFVSNLPYGIQESDLVDIFGGPSVVNTHIARYGDGTSKGYGFVEFGSSELCTNALGSYQNVEIGERHIIVRRSLQQRYNPSFRNQANGESNDNSGLEKDKQPSTVHESSVANV